MMMMMISIMGGCQRWPDECWRVVGDLYYGAHGPLWCHHHHHHCHRHHRHHHLLHHSIFIFFNDFMTFWNLPWFCLFIRPPASVGHKFLLFQSEYFIRIGHGLRIQSQQGFQRILKRFPTYPQKFNLASQVSEIIRLMICFTSGGERTRLERGFH